MPELKNSRYEIVAQHLAAGESQWASAAAAGLTKHSANRVCRIPQVVARARELNPMGAAYTPLVKAPPKRKYKSRRPQTMADVITDFLEVARCSREIGNYREANIALKRAADLIAERDGLRAPPKPTKKQKEQRHRNEPDPEGELNDDPPADNGGTPDISEIADVVGRLNDGPGDLTEAEATRAAAGGSVGSVHEANGNS